MNACIAKEAISTMQQWGRDPARLLHEAGLDPGLLDDALHLPLRALGSLLLACAEGAECPHFGLIVGAKVGVPDHWLEPLLRSDNFGASLRKLTALAGQESGAVFALEATDDVAVLSFLPYDPEAKGLAIAAEAVVASVTGVARSMCGPDWRPSEVLLVRRPPVHPEPYRAFFGCPVRFDQEAAALVVPARSLKTHVLPRNGEASRTTKRESDSEQQGPTGLVERVQQLLRKEMLQQKTELADVAQLLAMHRRTLSRRLRAEGTQFTFILSEMRFAVSRQLVAETDIPLAQVSAMLHFSEPAAFTRAFERWSGGMSPSQMRADHKRSPTA